MKVLMLAPLETRNATETMNVTPKAKTRVLIADDVARVRQGLKEILGLTEDFEVVGEAVNGLEAVQLAEKLGPDIVLMDLEMPVMDGVEATWQIKNRHLAKGVVVLTIHSHDFVRNQAVEMGADAFVEKGTAVKTLLATIQYVSRKGT
jgi:DNA-binding NarL/FixJ family response regulator